LIVFIYRNFGSHFCRFLVSTSRSKRKLTLNFSFFRSHVKIRQLITYFIKANEKILNETDYEFINLNFPRGFRAGAGWGGIANFS